MTSERELIDPDDLGLLYDDVVWWPDNHIDNFDPERHLLTGRQLEGAALDDWLDTLESLGLYHLTRPHPGLLAALRGRS